MKVVIIAGVGYQSSNKDSIYLGEAIKKKIPCEYEVFNWSHDPIRLEIQTALCSAQQSQHKQLSYGKLRDFMTEVILDFEFALKYGGVIDVPEADYYIGHSAGSLFAMSQGKPSTMMGSPAALVKHIPKNVNIDVNTFLNNIIENENQVLNLINKYDIIAYPLDETCVENVFFRGNRLNPLSYFPLSAHAGYWKSEYVVRKIVKHIKSSVK